MFGQGVTRRATSGPPKPEAGEFGRSVRLTSLLEAWVADELITPEQADRILARGDILVQAPPSAGERPHGRSSLVIEALGYLGGVIILVASILIASMYWRQVGTTARLVLVGGVAGALLAAGFSIPMRLDDVGIRLRAALWLVSTVAFAGFVGLLGAEALNLADSDVFLLVSSCVAAYAVSLWLISRALVQHLSMMVALMLTAAALTNELGVSDALPGFAVWGVALIWLLLGWGGLLAPRRLAMVFGAGGMFVGALTTIPTHAGVVLALLTSVFIVTAAVMFRDLPLLGVGALGTLFVLPSAVVELFPGELAAPIALLVVGVVLVGAGLFIARRRRTRSEAIPPARDFSVGTPRVAITAAGLAAAVVTAVIVTLAVL